MSLAADVREAVRERPFLRSALRAGLLNYAAAASWLAEDADLDGGTDAIATALRRYESELAAYATERRSATVSMRSGVGIVSGGDAAEPEDGDSEPAAPLLRVAGAAVTDDGDHTAILATGDVDTRALAAILGRLAAADVDVAAAGVVADSLVVVVSRRNGATAVRIVEAALAAVPTA
ncbi:DUF7523 family protein [Halorubrum vacuolatum]|uniref:Uncharacterized protein n=1 Tax=Halorubrum vacuolatum TaxID=63740 RepID=A0A238WAT8_HALVU|nr:hypothetical protein [Halorubrum vacuolatum]SNR43705.1 hypothetical protein SAMN06264855_106122 [Halorubrum vacuolatum]